MNTTAALDTQVAVQRVAGAVPLCVLALDTSTEACSAALLLPDGRVELRCALTERSHADLVLPMVDSILGECGLRLADLDGIAFGRGPGGFTGVRIAAGVAQGLAYGAGLRVAPVSSLASVAFLDVQSAAGAAAGPVQAPGDGVLVCNDARMNEVYWAAFRFDPADPCRPIAYGPERVGPPEQVEFPAGVTRCAGNGLPPHPGLRQRLADAGLRISDGLLPRADAVAWLGAAMLARGEGLDAVDALPAYVRDDVARPSRDPTVTGMS